MAFGYPPPPQPLPYGPPPAGVFPGAPFAGSPFPPAPTPSFLPGSTTQAFMEAAQGVRLDPLEPGIHAAQKTHREQIQKGQARMWGLRCGLYRQPALSRDFLVSFDYDMTELVRSSVKLSEANESLARDFRALESAVNNVLPGTASAEGKIQSLQAELQNWKQRCERSEKAMSSVVRRSDEDRKTIQQLRETEAQLREAEEAKKILQEQVSNKRYLWMQIHTAPEERAALLEELRRPPTGPMAGRRAATTTTTTSATSAAAARPVAAERPGHTRPKTAQPAAAERPGNNRPKTAQPPSNAMPASYWNYGPPWFRGGYVQHYGPPPFFPLPANNPPLQRKKSVADTSGSSLDLHPGDRFNTDGKGSPKERKRDTPRAVLSDPETVKWADEFNTLFSMIRGFCVQYFQQLPPVEGDLKARLQKQTDGYLWGFISNLAAHDQEASRGKYVLRLLNSPGARTYFLQRLIFQYVFTAMMSVQAWADYSTDCGDKLRATERELDAIDASKPHERQALIERRAKLIREIVESPEATKYRSNKITQHASRLKDILAVFLPSDMDSKAAKDGVVYDISVIASTAWDVSAKVLQAPITFVFTFNDVNSLFMTEMHEALDCSTDPRQLQAEKCRVKLCVTPAITLRKDQGSTIHAKNILKASVLVMKY
ncbi:uncharacterized protein B0T15DRAFT_399437 [Chaetomium strumarium]|uniref:Uncharacterized protein n=1 Tax=Chaetomium strumarium TaxID=1170767 RepID=A0AAJ0GQ00_9PEZI|nr:hypothetical protein B0T15DRAFT_399437 [Chaetomium strumarium]